MARFTFFLLFLAAFVLGGCDSDVGGPNRAPVAVVGTDAEAGIGVSVTLDGSGSYDPDGDTISYTWQVLRRPENSSAEPLDKGAQQTSMQLDVGGIYLVALQVFDGQMSSDRDVMQLRAAGCERDEECDDGLFCTGVESCNSGLCTSAGNPCEPADACDENTDTCGGCGDGEVSDPEECDPGLPQEDHCCDVGTCHWVTQGEADPQNVCSSADDCLVNTCDGAGGCDEAVAEDGAGCGSPSDSLCDNPDSCLGGVCQDNLEASDYLCRASVGPCDLEERCTGSSPDCPTDLYLPVSTPCTDNTPGDCVLAECDDLGICVQDHGVASLGAPCDAGNPCLTDDACGDGDGVCHEGSTQRDVDEDGHVDVACSGDDCDDSDSDVYLGAPAEGSGNICDAAGSCFDGKDNDCDGSTDSEDPDCVGSGYMCLYGPEGNLTTGGSGGTLTVHLDTAGYDPDDIVCYTDTSRLLAPDVLLSNDFEIDISGFTVSDGNDVGRVSGWPQNPATADPDDFGASVCRDNWLKTEAISTLGRTRIQLRYASKARVALDSDDYFVTEYSTDDSTWYQLDIQGDDFRENWQWFTHILPERCEDQANLYIRWSLVSDGDDEEDDCGFVDDVEIEDLPEPTVSWTLLANDFEPASGNAAEGNCGDDGPWLLALFDLIGDHADKICLETEAQNPLGTSSGDQGLRINHNHPNWIRDTDIDTRYVPTGSDLVADFYMQSDHQPADAYSNGWYSVDGGSIWRRLNGMGLDPDEVYDHFRFVLDPDAIGLTDLMVEFLVPTSSDAGPNDGFFLDDYSLKWTRSSHDEIGAFTDEGDGTYTATITSDLDGTANVTCIYHGDPDAERTDGLDGNSSPEPVVFE
ncbi:MAG: hypothetical protein JRF33_23245 [Deltaproteobacteria bacterium]|nr:hypothetical protein [Deltaproteobacteria bacterium]